MADLKELSSVKSFGGQQKMYTHTSAVCKCTMTFAIYLPPAAMNGTKAKVPVLYYLGGAGSDPKRHVANNHYQQYAAQYNLIVVCPDSSPRDTGTPGENGGIRMVGAGASAYLDATTPGWKDHYQMFTYVTEELVQLIETQFDSVLPGRRGIMGQSMGGHGSLICGLKRPDVYQSVSSFYPASNPSASMTNVYETYLGTDEEVWKLWDAHELIKSYQGRPLDLLVHMGSLDNGMRTVGTLVTGSQGKDNINIDLKIGAGYAHNSSYVNTVMEDVVKYHAEILHKQQR